MSTVFSNLEMQVIQQVLPREVLDNILFTAGKGYLNKKELRLLEKKLTKRLKVKK